MLRYLRNKAYFIWPNDCLLLKLQELLLCENGSTTVFASFVKLVDSATYSRVDSYTSFYRKLYNFITVPLVILDALEPCGDLLVPG